MGIQWDERATWSTCWFCASWFASDFACQAERVTLNGAKKNTNEEKWECTTK